MEGRRPCGFSALALAGRRSSRETIKVVSSDNAWRDVTYMHKREAGQFELRFSKHKTTQDKSGLRMKDGGKTLTVPLVMRWLGTARSADQPLDVSPTIVWTRMFVQFVHNICY